MSADAVLARLDGVRRNGEGRWMARCPGHRDQMPSLSIRELGDGRLLLHCFASCSVEEVVGALGLQLQDLFPNRPQEYVKGERRPFIPSDVFEIARQEIGVASVIACDMHKGREISEADYARLFVCVERLNDIRRAAYGK